MSESLWDIPDDADGQVQACVCREGAGAARGAKERTEVEAIEMAGKRDGRLKAIGGSMSDDWNSNLANETIRTLWFFENSGPR